jgi:hypothetical protein
MLFGHSGGRWRNLVNNEDLDSSDTAFQINI